MKDNAQTKEHAILLKALGVNQVIIVINKMDHTIPTPWNEARYHRIKEEVTSYLIHHCHFAEHHIRCIPVSGLSGENLISLSNESPGKAWYQDDLTLQEGLDTFFQLPPRLIDHAFRGIITSSSCKPLHHHEYEVEVSILQGKISTHRSIGLIHYSHAHCHLEPVIVQQIKRFSSSSSSSNNGNWEEIPVAYAREKVILRIASK